MSDNPRFDGGEPRPVQGPATGYTSGVSQPALQVRNGDVGAMAGALWQKWMAVLTRPSVDTFAAEVANASWPAIWLNTAVIAVAWALSDLVRHGFGAFIASGIYHGALPLVASGILFLVARVVAKGTGSYETQTYLYLLYQAPIWVALAVLNVIPFVGALLGVIATPLLAIYGLVLTYYMLQPAQRIDSSGALKTVLVLVAIGVVLALIVILLIALLFAALFAALMHG